VPEDARRRSRGDRSRAGGRRDGLLLRGKPQHLARRPRHEVRLLLAFLDAGTVYAGCSGALIASQSREQRRERGVRTGWVFGLGLVPHVSFGVHWDKVKVIPGLRSVVMSRVPPGSVRWPASGPRSGYGRRWRVRVGSDVRHAGGTEIHEAGTTFETKLADRQADILLHRGSTENPSRQAPADVTSGRLPTTPTSGAAWVRATSGGTRSSSAPLPEERPTGPSSSTGASPAARRG
jgi:hypothetical protein